MVFVPIMKLRVDQKSLKTSSDVIPANVFKWFWMPTFAGMTEFQTFYEFVKIDIGKFGTHYRI